MTLLKLTDQGLYCEVGDFYIDPSHPVPRAVVTHAHSDHARWGCNWYLASKKSQHLMRMRLGNDAQMEFLEYGESVSVGGVKVSLHPAGHILGSAQVRIEYQGRVEVVTGDYKLGSDTTCESFEPIRCHLLVTESTFGLPVYRWSAQEEVFDSINDWWRATAAQGQCCVLYAYAVGKSQRLLAGLDPTIGPIFTHGAVEKGCAAYRKSHIDLPQTTYVGSITGKRDFAGALVLAVPSAHGTTWLRRFGKVSTAMASGWMTVRGSRRRRSMDRGFALSDHVDWPSLMQAVDESDPETVWVTHGYSAVVARYLREKGRDAQALESVQRDAEEES
jgi:putative mRNA 3-end processing factor